MQTARARACDVCNLRKIRCNGQQPCPSCTKAGFDCSFAKKPQKPGPKGPREKTASRIKRKLQELRTQEAHPQVPNRGQQTPLVVHDTIPEFAEASHPNQSPRSYRPKIGLDSTTFGEVCNYLRIYHQKMYPVWPAVDVDHLIARMHTDVDDAETNALAFATCAATGAQLRLAGFDPRGQSFSIIDLFASEAERHRSSSCSQNGPTIVSILIAFFLSMYYSSRGKRFTSTLLLREALTLCELLDLDKENCYHGLEVAEQKYRRKIFWLLFVTERGNALQNDLATVLKNTIALPNPEDDKDPVTFAGFLSLAHLFVAMEGILTNTASWEQGFSKETFAQLQQKLRDKSPMPTNSNEVQKTDIAITQQWMRMLLWQAAMKQFTMTAGSSEDPLSLTYPALVARDALEILSSVSLDSVIAHGPGMELKIFEIANTLLDVINCIPSLSNGGSMLMKQGPRDIFHGLSCLLASLSRGKSQSLALLQGKIAESQIPFIPIPRFVELKDDAYSGTILTGVSSEDSQGSWSPATSMHNWSASPQLEATAACEIKQTAVQWGTIQVLTEKKVHQQPLPGFDNHALQLGLAADMARGWSSRA